MIYFIRTDGFAKIGCTRNIKSRLSELQVSNPHDLNVMGLFHGGFKKEEELHKLFADDRVRGEWYYLSDEIKEYVKSQYDKDLRYDEGLSDEIDPAVQTTFIRSLHSLALREVGEKLDITPQSVREIENRELHGTISMNVLRKYGDVLGYKLVYRFIPKDDSL